MRIYNLSKSARTEFIETLLRTIPGLDPKFLPTLKDLKIAELEDDSSIIFENNLKLFVGKKSNTTYFPLLKDEQILPALPSATVDMGAVKFVCNGANVMRPGIKQFSDKPFSKGDLIAVKEVDHSKAIAIGQALDEREKIVSSTKGQAISNLHYVGDKLWEALKNL